MKIKLLIIMILFPATVWAKNYTQDTNCTAAWIFTEGSGTLVVDMSGHDINGTFASSGHPVWNSTVVPGTFATNSVYINGASDYITLASSFQTLSTSTVVMWVNFSNTVMNRIFSSSTFTGSQRNFYMLDIYNQKVRFEIQRNGNPAISFTGNTTLSTNTWYHLAMVSGASGNTLYINGVAEAPTYGAGNSATVGSFNLTDQTPVTCINRFNYEGSYYGEMVGYVAETAVFNVSLSTTQINDLRANGLRGAAPAAVTSNSRVIIFN